jgi:hypothetical protein
MNPRKHGKATLAIFATPRADTKKAALESAASRW